MAESGDAFYNYHLGMAAVHLAMGALDKRAQYLDPSEVEAVSRWLESVATKATIIAEVKNARE